MPSVKLFRSRPAGVGNIGQLGQAVDVDFIRAQGSRAQRRLLEKHLKQQAAKEKAQKRG